MTLTQKWEAKLKPLEGRTIQKVRYLLPNECEGMGWSHAPLVLQLDDGTLLFASSDDEGNDGGTLFIQKGTKTETLPEAAPVIRL